MGVKVKQDTSQKSPAIDHVLLPMSNVSNSASIKEEEYMENVETLQDLFKGKKPPPAQSVKSLLGITRGNRIEWLRNEKDLSMHKILDFYPCFGVSKWVRA